MRISVTIAAICLFLSSFVIFAQEPVKNEAVAAPPPSVLKVKRSAVCSSVENREPAGVSDKFSKDLKELFFFTHITGAADSARIEHRWYYKGNRVQTTVLPVRSSSWRTFSKRSLIRSVESAGEWKVEAVDQANGRALGSAVFIIE